MAKLDLPSPEVLRQLLRYEPETGKLFWRQRTAGMFSDGSISARGYAAIWNSKYAHKEAFTSKMNQGYLHGSIFNSKFLAHRVIWALVHGDWPTDDIDHLNGVRTDNRLCNLRSVSRQTNRKNSARSIKNKSGVTGVYWHKASSRWRACITVDGKSCHIGMFDDLHEAASARKAAEEREGFHKNHGR